MGITCHDDIIQIVHLFRFQHIVCAINKMISICSKGQYIANFAANTAVFAVAYVVAYQNQNT